MSALAPSVLLNSPLPDVSPGYVERMMVVTVPSVQPERMDYAQYHEAPSTWTHCNCSFHGATLSAATQCSRCETGRDVAKTRTRDYSVHR